MSITTSTQPAVRLENWTLHDLFSQPLRIPNYQREYSWRSNHVNDLLNDIFDRETPYRMGTVILHETVGGLDIVDGQQRLVTLTILVRALRNKIRYVADPSAGLPLLNGQFSDGAARYIRNTKNEIDKFLASQTSEKRIAVLNCLQDPNSDCNPNASILSFAVLILSGDHALDYAYTFFDSVNSKGKPLTDFDLLKAHHLMFIPPAQEALATKHNDDWQLRDEHHAQLFTITLRRIRMWSQSKERDSRQERPDYNEFCSEVAPIGRELHEHVFTRYMQPAAFRSWRRVNDQIVLSMDYPMCEGESLVPTQITQTIEGGDAFFLYAKRYHELYESLFINESRSSPEVSFVRNLANRMENLYLQNAFRAVMLLYFDKFGEDHLIEAGVCIERVISEWRWQAKSLRIEGTLSHVLHSNIVSILRDALNSRHAVTKLLRVCQSLPRIQTNDFNRVQERYRNSLAAFYTVHGPKIPCQNTHAIIQQYLDNSTES